MKFISVLILISSFANSCNSQPKGVFFLINDRHDSLILKVKMLSQHAMVFSLSESSKSSEADILGVAYKIEDNSYKSAPLVYGLEQGYSQIDSNILHQYRNAIVEFRFSKSNVDVVGSNTGLLFGSKTQITGSYKQLNSQSLPYQFDSSYASNNRKYLLIPLYDTVVIGYTAPHRTLEKLWHITPEVQLFFFPILVDGFMPIYNSATQEAFWIDIRDRNKWFAPARLN